MPDSLTFIYTDAYTFLVPQASLFSERVNVMKDALMAPFGSVHHPFVYTHDKNVRTRGWSVPTDQITNINEDCLGYVVVVNVNLTNVVNFEVNIVEQGKKKYLLPCNAKRMFDNKGVVVKVGKDGALMDEIGAAETNVYCLMKV